LIKGLAQACAVCSPGTPVNECYGYYDNYDFIWY
jgi:hypothetical protein